MRTYKEPKRIDKPRIRDSAIRQLNDAAKFAAIHSAAVSLREEEEARKREESERPSGSCENHVIQDFSVEKNLVINSQTESYKTEVSLTTGTVTITEVANKPFPLSSSEPKNQADDKDSSFSSSLSSIPTDSYISSDGKLSDLDNSGISTHDPPLSPQRVTENGVDEEERKSDPEEEVLEKKNSALVSVEKKKAPKPLKKKAPTEGVIKKSPKEKAKKKVNKNSPEVKPVKGKNVKGKKKASPKEIHDDSCALDTSFGESSKTDESGASVSPRASKRTPKKNRKYHSDEEGQFQNMDDGSPSRKRSPRAVKKRKINFNEDDDDDFEDERFDFDLDMDLPEKVEIAKPKPPPKKRKKVELNSEIGENDNEAMVTDDLIPKPKKTKGLKKAKTKINSDDLVPDQTENEKGKESPPKKKKTVKKKKMENDKANESVEKASAMTVDKPPKKKRAPKKKVEKNVESKEGVGLGGDDGEEENEDGAEPEEKKEPVLISCPLCGQVSRSKSAYTRHIRRCVDIPRTDNGVGKSSSGDGAKVKEEKLVEESVVKVEKDNDNDALLKSSEDNEVKPIEEEEEEDEEKDHLDSSFDISGDEENEDKKPGESKPEESGPKKTINIETLMKKQGPDTTYKCEHCDYATPKRAMLGRHLRTHGIYVCLRCNFIYNSKDVLKEHVLQEHKDRADYKLCRKCSRYIRCHEISLEKHMEECTGPVPFKCKFCEKEFKYESSLKSHIIRHDPDAPKRFNCPQCTYKSNYKANLKKHLKNIHNTERVKKEYPCTFENCEKKFHTEDNLKRHMKFHSDVRNYPCPQCPKRFKTSAALRGHVIVHDPARPFKCNINDCTKDFRSKKLLKNHKEEFHNMTDKKFPCDFEGCTFTFFKRSHLQRHKISHTGERKFGCSVCGKAFRHADNLKVHMRQHTNEKPVACELCSFTCRQKSSLQYHLHKFHGIPPKPKKPKKPVDASMNSSSNDSKPILSSLEFKENQKDLMEKAESSFDNKNFTPKKRENPMDLYEFRSDEEFDDDSVLMPLRQDKTSTPIRHEKISFLSQTSKSDLLDRTSKSLDFEDDKLSDIDTQKDSKEPEDQKKKKKLQIKMEENMEEEDEPVKTTAKTQKPKKTAGRKKKGKASENKGQPHSDNEENSKLEKSFEIEEKPSKPKAKRGRKPKSKPEPVESTETAADNTEPEKAPVKPPRKKPGPKPKNKAPPAEDTKSKKKRGPKKKKPQVNDDLTEEESTQTQKKKRKYVRKKKADKLVEEKTKGRRKPEGAESQETEEEDTIIYSELEHNTANEDDGEATEIEGFNDDEAENKSPDSVKSVGRESPQEEVEKEPEEKEEEEEAAEEDLEEGKEKEMMVEEKEKVEEVMETKEVKEEEDKRTSEVESDRVSSGIDTDFEDDLKPPPAPRPPPVVESDEGDIESGPEDMDTPGRDFESTPPKSVQNHSVQSLPGRDYESTPRDYESTPPKSVPPDNVPNYGSNENKNDVMSPPSKGYSSVEAAKRDLSIDSQNEDREMSNPVPSNISYPQAGSVELPPSVASNPPQGSQSNTGYGSQSESAMPEVDKDYLGQYLQQFDSGGRSSDDNSRLNPSVERPPEHINIPPSPQDKELPPLNLSSSVPPLNLSTTPDRDSMHTKGADLSNKRMEILTCDRQQEEHFQQRSENPTRTSERIPDNVYEGFPTMNSYIPGSRENPSLFPPTTTGSSSYAFSESDSILQRQRMTTPFLTQSDPNALQNLHRMADSALTANNPASLLRRPTTVPSREEIFPPPSAVSQTMARNPFHTSWTSQDVRHPHWSQASYLQRPGGSTTNPLFPKDNYLSGRDFMFDTSRRSVTERNMFPGLPQTQRPDLSHETFPGFEFGYFGGHGYPGAPPLDYTRSSTQTAAQKTLDERYRQSATGMSDFRTLPPSSSSDMFRSMNPSFNFDKYMYSRDPVYHPQHVGDTTNSPFLTPGVPSQHAMFERDYTRGFYHQNSPYSFMNDKPYAAAAAAASAKLTHPSTPGMGQERDFVPRPNTAAAAAADSQIPMQDPYRHPMLYNMMNRYFES
nr:transcriptional regulator ATRX isoform X2 [Crassostrea gigas]